MSLLTLDFFAGKGTSPIDIVLLVLDFLRMGPKGPNL